MVEPSSIRANVALAAYAEPLAEGHRVIVFGDASSGISEHLLDRGARLIHVYDPEPSRVAEAAARNTSRNVSFAPLSDGGLAIRDGTFELAIVDDLSQLPEPEALLRRVKRTLAPRGAALIASPNPDVTVRLLPEVRRGTAFDYYALYDLIAGEFEHITMLGENRSHFLYTTALKVIRGELPGVNVNKASRKKPAKYRAPARKSGTRKKAAARKKAVGRRTTPAV